MSKPNSKLLSIAPHLLRWHAKLRHFEFRQAVSEDDFEAALRIRNDVYLNCGYIDPAYPKNNNYHDKYGDVSITFLAFHKNKPVGTIRLIKTCNGSPSFDCFNILDADELKSNTCCEIGSFAILDEHRKSKRFCSLGLTASCYFYSLKHDIHTWIGCAPRNILDSFLTIADYKVLRLGEIDDTHREARKSYSGYFQKYGDTLVVLSMSLAEIKPWRFARSRLASFILRLWH